MTSGASSTGLALRLAAGRSTVSVRSPSGARSPLGRYLDDLTEGSASSYLYVYTLLRTLSHSMMRAIAESSGLDLGSLGEYLGHLGQMRRVYTRSVRTKPVK
jgi:hypothetical protein